MRKFCITPSAPLLLLLAVSALSTQSQAQTFVQDRIAKSIDASSMERLPDSIHPLAKRALDQGMADNSKVLHGMGISFNRTGAQEAALQAMLKAQQDKTSPSYHKWLTPTQFGQQFGMSRADLDKVTGWLQQQGFTITTVAQSNNAIGFSGSVASVEKAFQTQIHNYSLNGEIHFANATAISLPASLAGAVSSVRGLDDFRLKPRVRFMQKTAAARKAHYTSGVGGSHFVAPGDFSVIYDLNPLYSAGNTGAGITIAVVGQTDILVSDITDFRAAAGLTVNNPTVVTVPGTVPTSVVTGAASDDLAETDLDLEWSGGVAPGASVVLVNSDNVFTSLQYAIANTINGISVPIISMSYGACEAGYQSSTLTSFEGFLAQANAQGQTLVLAAGDVGAADCDESDNPQQPDISATQGLAVDYPGSSVYVTDAGGSEFMGDGTAASPQTGAGQYWSANGSGSTSDDVVTSAISYIPEMVWNDTTVSLGNGGGFDAGGGGVSALWKKPSWQAGVPGIPADGFRDVPDISLDASNYHDPYLYCTQMFTDGSPSTYISSCQANSFRVSDPGQQDDQAFISLAGGTSFSAPSFAGILAVIEQKIASGGGLGNINPALYTMASNATTYASAFHDITTGNNQVPCTTGFPNCPAGTNQVIGYSAAAGYDQATGIGSIDANNLATSFAALVAATGTKTALVATPGTTLAIGESVTFSASVTPNTLSSAPTGTVTFTVDGVAQTPVPLSSGPPFTASLTTSFSTAGSHVVSATYSGDSTYTPSTSNSETVTVVSQGTQATTTVVTANPTTVALGSNITLTATITATTDGTLNGPVTFTTGGVTIGTVKQVTLSNNNTATATVTVAATASLGFVAGTDTITAAYGGDTSNGTSTGTTTVTVTNPSISLSATNVTISSPSPGNTGTSTITLTSAGGYAGTVTVSATASTLNADYGFGSTGTQTVMVPLASGATGTTTLTLTTIAASGNVHKGLTSNLRKVAAAGGTAAGCLLLLLIPGVRRKRWPAALALLVFLSIGAGFGCGGGTGGAAPGGTYTVTVNAVDSSNAAIMGTTTFTVTIQ